MGRSGCNSDDARRTSSIADMTDLFFLLNLNNDVCLWAFDGHMAFVAKEEKDTIPALVCPILNTTHGHGRIMYA